MSGADFITVRVAATKGSAPRDAGATLLVFADRQSGTIGGGALEWEATHVARQMLETGGPDARRTLPLGPDLGQCCGGSVTLEFTRNLRDDTPLDSPLWIWGAGHVGRAIANVMAPFEDREIRLVDVAADRFPEHLNARVMSLVAADPLRVVPRCERHADHLIVTYSHDLDLALCDALLRRGFASCGLIGSATKWARFQSRLRSMGHTSAQISRIACPIGDPALGKHPQAIAISVATALISSSAHIAEGMTLKGRTG